jgi:gamma-butyrobetaine dioxygenase
MDAAERAEFEAHPQAGAALRLRRWDDAAKDPAASPPAFGYYKPLLRRLLLPQGLQAPLRPGSPLG